MKERGRRKEMYQPFSLERRFPKKKIHIFSVSGFTEISTIITVRIMGELPQLTSPKRLLSVGASPKGEIGYVLERQRFYPRGPSNYSTEITFKWCSIRLRIHQDV